VRANVGVNVILSRRRSVPRASLLGLIAGIVVVTLILTWYVCLWFWRGVMWLAAYVHSKVG
jgi:hypothetical protein